MKTKKKRKKKNNNKTNKNGIITNRIRVNLINKDIMIKIIQLSTTIQ